MQKKVLGANYGTGKMGGLKSVFLMGCYNKKLNKWQLFITRLLKSSSDAKEDK